MELVYRLATETSPLIKQIRDNVIVSVTPRGRRRRPRSQRRLVLSRTQEQRRRAAGARCRRARRPAPKAAAGRQRRRAVDGGGRGGAAAAVLGQVRLPRQQSRHQSVAESMRALADWYFTAHPPIMHDLHESLPLLYTYSGGRAAEPEPRSDPLRRAAVVLELRAGADDQVGHAGRLHARVHGRLVAGLPRVGRLQPQRHDAHVRDAVGPRGRSRRGGGPRWRRAASAAAAGAPGGGPGRGARCGPRDAGARDAGKRRGGDAPMRARARRAGAGPAAGRGRAADGTRRRTAPRVVSRHSDSARRRQQLHAPRQHQLHADRRAERAAAHGHVPQPHRRELLPEDEELDRGRQDRGAVRRS